MNLKLKLHANEKYAQNMKFLKFAITIAISQPKTMKTFTQPYAKNIKKIPF